MGVFRKETVTGMDGIDSLLESQVDDFVDAEVGIDRAFALADEDSSAL
jgi:hypothetical protein